MRLFRYEYVEDAAKLEEAIGLSVPETILEMAASNYLENGSYKKLKELKQAWTGFEAPYKLIDNERCKLARKAKVPELLELSEIINDIQPPYVCSEREYNAFLKGIRIEPRD